MFGYLFRGVRPKTALPRSFPVVSAKPRPRAQIEPLEERTFLSASTFTKTQPVARAAAAVVHKVARRTVGSNAIPGIVQAEFFDTGGEGTGYHDTTTANEGKQYRLKEGVDIAKTNNGGAAGYDVTVTHKGEWLEYTVNVAQSTTYNVEYHVGSAGIGGKFHLNVDGKRRSPILTVPYTGPGDTWSSIFSTLPLTSGKHVIRLFMDAEGSKKQTGKFDWIAFRLPPPAAPSGLSVTLQSDTSLLLKWKDNSNSETKFIIERALSVNGPWTVAGEAPTNNTAFLDTNLDTAASYFYRVQSANPTAASDYTNVVTETTGFSPPITITAGGTYHGNWQSLDPSVAAVTIATDAPVIIENSVISSFGDLISARGGNANITVRNTTGYGVSPFVAGLHAGRFLNVDGFANISVTNSYMEGTSGIYVADYHGNQTAAQTVKILNNVVRNIDGRIRTADGGFTIDVTGDHYAQFFQVNNAAGLSSAEVGWNEIINNPWESYVEDVISIYAASGIPASPILIHDNYIQGGYTVDPSNDANFSGGGIMVSDGGSSYVSAIGNTVLETSNYGIAISSGHDNQILNNRVIASGVLPDGTQVAAQNVGIYISNLDDEPDFANNSGSGNVIGWMMGYDRNDDFAPDASSYSGNTYFPDGIEISTDTTAAEWNGWKNKVAAAGKTLGPTTAPVATTLVITKGGTYSGNFQSLNPDVPAIRIRTSEPVIIQNSVIRSRGSLIDALGYEVNLTVRNNTGYGLNPDSAGRYPGRFLDVDGFVNVDVENNYLEGTAGMYFYNYLGDGSASQTIKVLKNSAKNIDGRVSDGNGGWQSGPPNADYYKQFFQINGVQGLTNAEVAYNQVINEQGKSRVEENINIFNTTGTAASPFAIHDNYVQGAFPNDALDATDYTGGGIMMSDIGSSYIHAYNNYIIGTGSVGVMITSGHDNEMDHNVILSSGLSPASGAQVAYSNTGAVIWNFNKEPTFLNNFGHDNLIGWVKQGARNDWFIPGASSWINNTPYQGAITLAVQAAQYNLWLQSMAGKGIIVGPH